MDVKVLQQAKEEFIEKYDINASNTANFNDFQLLRTLGVGGFGRVMIVHHKSTGKHFALKIFNKKKIVKLKQTQHTLNEKRLLQAIKYPFIVELHYSFKDNSYLYLVLEYVPGGELFSLLRKLKRFPENHSRFYVAQLVLTIEYLHHLDIVYRDIKPENILINANGYIKLADFGFAKHITSRTYTLCGTPDYLAPEIIISKGYGKAVDWWALGVFIFELSAGYTPFSADEHLQIYNNILKGYVDYPEYFSKELKYLIMNLLQLDPTKRYGNQKNGVNDIKNLNWFAKNQWTAIFQQTTPAPYIPQCYGSGDTQNFELIQEEKLDVSDNDEYQAQFESF